MQNASQQHASAQNSSFSMHGIGVSSGIAIGRAHLVSNALLEVVHYQLPTHFVDDEITRFKNAVQAVKHDLELIRQSLSKNAPAEIAGKLTTLWQSPMLLNEMGRNARENITQHFSLDRMEEKITAFVNNFN